MFIAKLTILDVFGNVGVFVDDVGPFLGFRCCLLRPGSTGCCFAAGLVARRAALFHLGELRELDGVEGSLCFLGEAHRSRWFGPPHKRCKTIENLAEVVTDARAFTPDVVLLRSPISDHRNIVEMGCDTEL